jgi:hypothetical protein
MALKNIAIIPKRREDDALTKIAKGLNIAQSVLGGIGNFQKIQSNIDAQKATKLKAAEERRRFQSRELSPQDAVKVAQSNEISPAKEGDLVTFGIPGKEGQFTIGKSKKPNTFGVMTPAQSANLGFKQRAEDRAVEKVAVGKEEKAKKGAQIATFALRLEDSIKQMDELKKGGFDRSSRATALGKSMLPESFETTGMQQQDQAERNFVNALLRRESGAAISDQEFASAEKQYFDRAGDGPEVLDQKAKNRRRVMGGLKAEAGDKSIALVRKQMGLEPEKEDKPKSFKVGGKDVFVGDIIPFKGKKYSVGENGDLTEVK